MGLMVNDVNADWSGKLAPARSKHKYLQTHSWPKVPAEPTPPKFTKSVSFPSAFRVTRFRTPASGPVIIKNMPHYLLIPTPCFVEFRDSGIWLIVFINYRNYSLDGKKRNGRFVMGPYNTCVHIRSRPTPNRLRVRSAQVRAYDDRA